MHAILNIEGEEFNVLRCTLRLHQHTSVTGFPRSITMGEPIVVTIETTRSDTPFCWAASHTMAKSGSITFYDSTEGKRKKKVEFAGGRCVDYAEGFGHSGGPMAITLHISAQKIRVGDVEFIRNWPEEAEYYSAMEGIGPQHLQYADHRPTKFEEREVFVTDKSKGKFQGLKIVIGETAKIDRNLLEKPKRGDAPTFKSDGTKVEIHHKGQKPDGPFEEMHWERHRGKGNDQMNHPDKKKPSKVDRKEFAKAKRKYWANEFDIWKT